MTLAKVQNRIQQVVFALFLVLVFSLGFMKPSVSLTFIELTPTDLVFPIFFLSWLIAIALDACRFEWRNIYSALLIYLAALLVSAICSVNPSISFAKLAGVLYLVLLAVSTANLVTTVDRLKLLFLAWLVGAIFPMLTALVGILIFYIEPGCELLKHITYHYGAVPMGNFPRVSSTFVSPSMFCNYLTVTLMLTLISERMGWIRRNVAVALLVAISLCAVFTVSIAFGGVALAAGLWILFAASRSAASKIAVILTIAVAVAFLAIAPFALQGLAEMTFTPSSRLLVWKDALTTFFAHPITGKGLGTGAASVTYQNSDGTWSLLTDGHNTFLNVAAESGITGIVGLLFVMVAMLRTSFSQLELSNDLKLVRLGLGIAFVTAFLYQGLTGSFEDAKHLWVLIGSIMAVKVLAIKNQERISNQL